MEDYQKYNEQMRYQKSPLEQQATSKNLKKESLDFGDVLHAGAREVIPLLRNIEDGNAVTNLFWENDENFDLYSEEAQKITSKHELSDFQHFESAGSLAELKNTSNQIMSAREDMEVMELKTNFAGSLGVYALASLFDPFTYTGYGTIAKLNNLYKIGEKLHKGTRTGRAMSLAATGAVVEGSSEAVIQSTGAREYEQVGYTALFASVLGGGGRAITDTLKYSQAKTKQEALDTMAEGKIDPKVDPEKAEELINIFEQDKLAPIRGKALELYDSTIGKIMNNRFTSSPMIRAWRKGGVVSALASKFDTNVGMSKDMRSGNTIHNNQDTAFDLKYQTFEEFAKMEKARLDVYANHVKEMKESGTKPLSQAEFSEKMYDVIVNKQVKYTAQKMNKISELEKNESIMKEIRDEIQSRIDKDESLQELDEVELSEYKQSLEQNMVSKRAREEIEPDIDMSHPSPYIQNFIESHNNYYKSFSKRMQDTGVDPDGFFDSNFYMPRVYNQEKISASPELSTKIIAEAIATSPEYAKVMRDAHETLQSEIANASKASRELVQEAEAINMKMEQIDNEIKLSEDRFNNWEIDTSIHRDDAWAIHPRLEELLYMRENVKASDTKYAQTRVSKRSGNEDYQTGGIYERNYAADFMLTKSDVAKIRKGNITDALRDKLDHDLGRLDTDPMYKQIDDYQYPSTIDNVRFNNENIQKSLANGKRVSKAEQRYIDAYKQALDIHRMSNSQQTFEALQERLSDLYKHKKKTLNAKRTRLKNQKNKLLIKQQSLGAKTPQNIKILQKKAKEQIELERKIKEGGLTKKEYAQTKSKISANKKFMDSIKVTLPDSLSKAVSEVRRLEKFPIKSAKAMVDNIVNKTEISQLDMDSLTPSRLKDRKMMIAPTDKMKILMHTNEAEIAQMYQYQTSGQLAVKHATGHMNVNDFIEDLKAQEKKQVEIDQENYKKALAKWAKTGQGSKPEKPQRQKLDGEDIAIAKDLFELTKGTRQIPNNPDNVWEKAVRRVTQYNYMTMGGQFAKYGLSEIGAGVYSTGFRYFKELVPALGDVIKMYRHQDLSTISKDFMRLSESSDISQHNTRAAYSDTEHVESIFARGIDRTLQRGSEFMFRYTGLEAITVLTKMALPRAFLGRIIDEANAGKVMQPDLLRWGITPDDMIAISKENFKVDEYGKVDDFNFDGWKDQDLARRFQRATTRMTRDTIMRPDAVRLPIWMTNRAGRNNDPSDATNVLAMFTKQFMSFTMLAHERLLLRGLNEKTAMATTGALTSAMLLMAVAGIQEEMSVAMGYTDEDDRKYDLTTAEGIWNTGKFAATRHSFAGQVGMVGESLVSIMNPTYRSGEQALTKVAGGATASRFFSTRNVVEELWEGNYGTQNQQYFLKSLAIGNNMIGVGSVLDNEILDPMFGRKDGQ